MKAFICLEIDIEDERDASKEAEGIADSAGAIIVGVFSGFDVQTDNDGQIIVYTGATV